ncbi:MAG: protein kinase [Gemmataceae bacterium]|nr:protein kinase [Gemmata sp.]MDW8196954.1 protein kinase [Gemmataceae bacterium]
MTVESCPNWETLAAFAHGELPAPRLATVADHVAGCEACCQALQRIPPDSLAQLARAAAAAAPRVPSPAVSAAATASSAPSAESASRAIPPGFLNHPRYRIVGQLGTGGMGTVYQAEDLWMGRVVAIKVVAAHWTTKASAAARFRREVQAAARLAHHNIIRAYDTGEVGGRQFLVMEFAEGVSLDQLVATKGPLPVAWACLLIRQAAFGLQHAAEQGIVHRDIKPHNLLVTRKGQLKILDFGLARFASLDDEPLSTAPRSLDAATTQTAATVTNPHLLLGTPDYLAPEQARNPHEVDPRSDIYSLGCTFYFLLTGHPPFHQATTLLDKLHAHTHCEPISIRQLRPDLPPGLDHVLATMMAKNPVDRYAQAAEVAAALWPFTRSDAGQPAAFALTEAVAVHRPTQSLSSPPAAVPVATDTPDSNNTRQPATRRNYPPPRHTATPPRKGPSWWKRPRGWLVGGLPAVLLLVGVAMVPSSSPRPVEKPTSPDIAKAEPPPPASRPADPTVQPQHPPGRPRPAPPIVIAPPPKDELVVLYVVPRSGVTIADVVEVRQRLTRPRAGKKPIRIEIAATTATRALAFGSNDSLAIDVHLTEGMKLDRYAAVIFSGFAIDEYVAPTGRGRRVADHVLREMHQARKPIAAICAGQAVLAAHGVLKNRAAAIPTRVFDHSQFQRYFHDPSIRWQKRPMVIDDTTGPPVITVAGAAHADLFVQALWHVLDRR